MSFTAWGGPAGDACWAKAAADIDRTNITDTIQTIIFFPIVRLSFLFLVRGSWLLGYTHGLFEMP